MMPRGDISLRPHVLYVTTVFGHPPRGGPQLRTSAVLSAIARVTDVSLLLLTPPEIADAAAARVHFSSFCRSVAWPAPAASSTAHAGGNGTARAAPGGILRRLLPPFLRRPLGLARSHALRVWDRRRQIETVAAAVSAQHIDVVWVAYGNVNYHLADLRRRTGRPVVIDTDSVWSRFILRELPYRRGPLARATILLRGWAKRFEERRGTGRADVTTAVSAVDQAYYRGLVPGGGNILLMPNALEPADYARYAAFGRTSPPVLLFSGTMSTASNEDAAVWLVRKVLPLVRALRPDVTVVIAGRDPGPGVLALAGDGVRIASGGVDVGAELARAAVAVVPLRFESGTRYKILEAFACGTPVVSSTLGAEGLEVQDGRHLLIADTPERFAEAVLALLRDPKLGERLSEAAAALLSREYSVEALERHVRAVLGALGHACAPPGGLP